MPFLDGYEATKQIRVMYANSGIEFPNQPPIIAITGHVEQEYVERAKNSGMNQVF